MNDTDIKPTQTIAQELAERIHEQQEETDKLVEKIEEVQEQKYINTGPGEAYQSNDPLMNTLPPVAHNEYDHFQSANDFRGGNTQKLTNARRTFNGKSTDRSGLGMKHYARLSSNWNDRFHVSPDRTSHAFYSSTRSTQFVTLQPKRKLQTQTKSRLPTYSKMYKARPIKKELCWVDNFSVTHSKNNHNIHHKYREFFDKPVNYKGAVTIASTKGKGDPMDKKMFQITTKKPTATVHYLVEEKGNRHINHKDVQK
jgi:hypothetical protein